MKSFNLTGWLFGRWDNGISSSTENGSISYIQKAVYSVNQIVFWCSQKGHSLKEQRGTSIMWRTSFWHKQLKLLFSSPELKAQVSFSNHLSSVVCLSVRSSVRPFVNFSYFRFFFQNHWANFNQTWHKASLIVGDSGLFKGRPCPFLMGDNYEIAKIHRQN